MPAFETATSEMDALRSMLARHLLRGAIAIGIAAAIVFTLFPSLDLIVARMFLASPGHFVGQSSTLVTVLRNVFIVLFFGVLLVALAAIVAHRMRGRTIVPGLDQITALFVVVCLVAGPGLVTNLIFKDHWGRARPAKVSEFGGTQVFTPPLRPTNQCERNCSFVSGEASSSFALFYTAALAWPQSGAVLLAIGTIAGLANGAVRMAQGGHFLSDVIFAGLFMALTVVLVHYVVFASRWRLKP